jgi:serine/threonine protein kinase
MTEMHDADWDRLSNIVAAALDVPLDQQAELVARLTAGDEALAREANSLLAHSTQGDTRAGTAPTLRGDEAVTPARKAEAMIGERLGPWQLKAVLGQGGMGVVYAAERVDGAYHQRAAVKLLRDGFLDDTAEALLVSERQHLARLDHANIARLLDGGQTASGRPYLVMEFVEGEPIDLYCRTANLGLVDRIKLLLPIFDAVQSAHEKLIIHRDIKPANVLATANGEPKLLDFGVAKLVDATAAPSAATQMARLPFTPRYASPEQIDAQPVTVRTDVYGLGVLAFELLAGDSPFACFAKTVAGTANAAALTPWQALDALRTATARLASNVAVTTLPTHTRALRGDLETVLGKAISRAPADRYASVADFAADLRAFLEGRPVAARPLSPADRAWKFCRRHPVAVSLAGTLTTALVATAAIAFWQAARAERNAAEAVARTTALRQIARTMIFDVNDSLADGTTAARGKLLSTATQFLNGLSAEESADMPLKRDTAEAFERLGDIAGNASLSNLGNAAVAEGHYRKALALREQLIASQPDNFADVTGMMKIHQRLGRMALDRGDANAARSLCETQARWADKAATHRPDDINAQLAVGEAKLNLATVHYYPGRKSLNDFSSALKLVDEAVAHRAGLFEKAKKNQSAVRGYAQPLVTLTQLQLVHGQAAAALQTVNRIGPVIEALWSDPAMRTRLAPLKISELRHRGEAQIDMGDRAAGLQSLSEAVALADEVAAADLRNVFLERRAATTRSALAYHQLRAGQSNAALTNSRAYLAVISRQQAAQPEVANLRVLRDDAITALIEVLIAAGRPDEARAMALAQIDAEAKQKTVAANDDSARLFSIAQAHHWQGMALLSANARDVKGLALIREGTERIDRALASDPFDANMQRMLAEQRVQAGDALRRDDPARACVLFAKADEAFATLKSEQRLSANFTQVSAHASTRAAECAAGR